VDTQFAGFSAALNAYLIVRWSLAIGWSFVISMLSASFLGALIISDSEDEV
jgi:hypothetical protein